MRKRIHKQRRAKKPMILLRFHWGWKLGTLALLIGCLWLVANAASHRQASTLNVTSQAAMASVLYPTPIISATPVIQRTTGVFPLAEGGPIPVPANVFRHTNIARVILNDMLTSIYAGAMTRAPDIGALAILQENLKTGQQSLHIYQTRQRVGALTIVSVHGGMVVVDTARGRGEFDLGRGVFWGF